jgi:hypothetical protein
MPQYTVRYRCDDRSGRVALIVDDEYGIAHLFSDGRLRDRLAGDGASARLARRLADRGAWVPVPEVSPYTIHDLRRLIAAPASRDGSRCALAPAPSAPGVPRRA